MLTDQFLFKGAGLSLKNACNIINASVYLLDKKYYPQAVALATYAHEQIGQFRILEEIYFDAEAKKRITPFDLKKKLESGHVYKQMKAVSGIGLTYPRDSQQGILNENFHKAIREQDFEKIKELEKDRQALVDRKRKRMPQDRENTRLKSLYVDINNSGDDWMIPEFNPMYAFNFVAGTCSDYGVISQYTTEGLKDVNNTAIFTTKIVEETDIEIKSSSWPN